MEASFPTLACTMKVLAVSLVLFVLAVAEYSELSRAPRFLDQFSSGFMMEDGARAAAAPECKDGLGWVYYNGNCYLFTRSGQGRNLREKFSRNNFF